MVSLSEESPLVLGSGSPRRREILTSLGIPHVVFTASVDETAFGAEPPSSYLERIVRAKREECVRRLPADLSSRALALLVADTIVVVDGETLGKPRDVADAADMIARLAGRTHEVQTRFAIATLRSSELYEETVTTLVTFRALGSAQVRAYAASGEGTDKAGAYAVQGLGAGLVSRIEGSYTNVVGLPAAEVVVALEHLGLA